MLKKFIVLPPTRRPRGSSKWFDVVIVKTTSSKTASRYAGSEHRPLKALSCREIKPSAAMARIIAACLAEADELMRVFRLPPARIAVERVHVLSGRSFKRLFKNDRHSAVSFSGHIYLNASHARRHRDLDVILTHELAHMVSFGILLYAANKSRPFPIVGLKACACHLGRLGEREFGALNEVTTEMAAHSMRIGLIEKGIVAPKDVKYVESYWRTKAYAPLSLALIELIRPTPKQMARFQRQLVRDMLTGGRSSFPTLKRHGLLEELLNLTDSPEKIVGFLERHGF